jgi:hypothetical protein
MQVMRKLFFAHLHQAIRSEFEGMLRVRPVVLRGGA